MGPEPSFATHGEQLLDGASASWTSILEEVKAIQDQIRRLRGKVSRFEKQENFTAILAHLFGVEPDSPGEWPDLAKLEPLWGLFRDDEAWRLIEARLSALAGLPLVPRKPGTLPHTTLKKAVGEIRAYWIRIGRSWPKDIPSAVEPGDDRCVLKNPVDRFVADALGASGFPFTLDHLSAAWRKRSVKAKMPT